jgi:NAD(P)-dependent dehydrogenase (short-subunit alcohol dehydrogenase family)
MTNDFQGLTAIVTGGASGIGAATATYLLERGCRVAVLDLRPDTAPDGAIQIRCDISNTDSVTTAVSDAVTALGGLDILINNAGSGAQGDITSNSDDEWETVLNVNVVGIAQMTRAALPHLRLSSHAAIVNTSSIAAGTGLSKRALYSATKGAVHALTLAMAADHLHEGIRVNSVAPGTADTPWVGRLLSQADDAETERSALNARQPHGRLVTAQEVAGAIGYLAHPGSGSTVGVTLHVDGGMASLRPRAAR